MITPAFVIDEDQLSVRVAAFQHAMERVWPGGIIGYSVKTNSLPWVVAWMARHGVWAEVVSDDEYNLATRVGHDPERIIFNGPVKSREGFVEALRAGSIVNIDSRREVRWAVQEAAEHPDSRPAVGLRVNWDLDTEVPGESTSGPAELRFGFSHINGDFDDALFQLRRGGVRVTGLHFHATSVTRSLNVYRSAARSAVDVIRRHGLDLEYIDLGGGFFGGEDPRYPSPDEYLEGIRQVLIPTVDPRHTRLVIEPGTAFVAAAQDYFTTVIDAKSARHTRFVVIDGSRNHVDPMWFGAKHTLTIVSDSDRTVKHQTICGSTCIDLDRLAELDEHPELREGDTVIFRGRGHYTGTFDSQFIYYLPPVYVREISGDLRQVRERGTTDRYLEGNVWDQQ